MVRGEKGFRDKHGKQVKRDQPISTRTGIIVYKGTGDRWIIDFPDDTRQYGGVDTIKLINMFYYLGHGKKLDEARGLSRLLTSEEI